MSRKKKVKYHTFTEGGIRYMQCSLCSKYVRGISENTVSVKCSRCVMFKMAKEYPIEFKPVYKPTGRPAGWHFMKEFVDKDGNVFHKGKEQPKLKGTLQPTKIKPRKKIKRRTKQEILVTRYKKVKKAKRKAKLEKAIEKQRKFLDHNIDKE